ncbi:unnamed protein product [Staurois parvus]|uniref:Uncharacterized protein n=1 Tax=Staurois parvus TaxID=386267 RepID=A0ABN9BIW9_9NEOB|nr:unnamed protein product [Staurois parvus]
MCRVSLRALYYQQMDWELEDGLKQPFYTMQRMNPLGSPVSIASIIYCIYRLILLLWV